MSAGGRDALRRLYGLAAGASGAVALLRRLNRSRALVLAYHGFTPGRREGVSASLPELFLPAPVFAAQLRYLARNYRVVPLSHLVAWLEAGRPVPERTAAITMDDGYLSTHALALPLLRHYGMPATIFLATGFIDRQEPFWWDAVAYVVTTTPRARLEVDLGDGPRGFDLARPLARRAAVLALVEALGRMPEPDRSVALDHLAGALDVDPRGCAAAEPATRPLTWEAIREMGQAGVEFGSHTVSHTVLSRCGPDRVEWELVESRRTIEQQLGQSCELFCYPNGRPGDWDAVSTAALRKAEYRGAVTAVTGLVGATDDLYALPRVAGCEDRRMFMTTTAQANARALAGSMRRLAGRSESRARA